MRALERLLMNEDRCFFRCNACHHIHYGHRSQYRCPHCSCNAHVEHVSEDA